MEQTKALFDRISIADLAEMVRHTPKNGFAEIEMKMLLKYNILAAA